MSVPAALFRARPANAEAFLLSYGALETSERFKPQHLDGMASPRRVITRTVSHQLLQCRGIVDIVPRRQFHEIKTKLHCPSARGCGHRAGAPGDISEQPCVGKTHPQEGISAVIASSQHHTSMVAG